MEHKSFVNQDEYGYQFDQIWDEIHTFKERAAPAWTLKFVFRIGLCLGIPTLNCIRILDVQEVSIGNLDRQLYEQQGSPSPLAKVLKCLAEINGIVPERARAGIRFHSKVEQILKNKPKIGIPSLDRIMNESEPTIHGYMQSVFNVLKSLPFTVNPMILEGRVTHHDLQYTGRFDAVLRFDDGPCLIDWKTASERSSVAINVDKGDGLKGLYGYPKQLAAYVGAFNSDPSYQHLDKVKRGMIVMAYDSGREAEVIDMSSDELEENWSHFVADVSGFWREIQDGKTNFVCSE